MSKIIVWPKCSTCLWWDETQGDMRTLGQCRRRAPSCERALDIVLREGINMETMKLIDEGPWGQWPWTKADWFCGDHVPREGEENAARHVP